MKLIFGNTVPHELSIEFTNIDTFFYNYLINSRNSLQEAVEVLIEVFGKQDRWLWTCNPMIPNYMDDDYGAETIYVVVGGELINFKDDASLMKKLKFMGLGEALMDDVRVLYRPEPEE